MDLPSTPTSNDAFRYEIAYKSQFDFKTYKDSLQNKITEISTLDSQLFRLLQAYGGTKFNIPYWVWDGTKWVPNDSLFGIHTGIKLLYNATFTSSANKDTPLKYSVDDQRAIFGFNAGFGVHTIPFLSQYNITQNNGTTTYIGNDILQPYLIQGNQASGADGAGIPLGNGAGVNEASFSGTNNSQPYTRDNYSIKNLLPTGLSGMTIPPSSYIDMWCNVTADIFDMFTVLPTSVSPYLDFVLFEIDLADKPPLGVGGRQRYGTDGGNMVPLARIALVDGVNADQTINTTVPIRLYSNKAYVFCIILDSPTGISGTERINHLNFNTLQFSIISKVDTLQSAPAPQAPFFPASSFNAFRLHTVLEKLVPYLDTIQTDAYGFPVPVSTNITGVSTFLSDPTLDPIYDAVPYNVLLTSAYSIHNLDGQSYLSISINDLFDFCNKVFQCGMSIDPDTNGDQTILRIENLTYYFNPTVMLMNLGTDIYDLTITQLTDNLGCNLKAGYTKADTNSDFGIDAFNTELYYNTPLSTISGAMDFEETVISTEMYAIEKTRAQQVSQAVSATNDPANPSTDNPPIALYCTPNQVTAIDESGSIINGSLVRVYRPDRTPIGVFAYGIQNYPTAQNTDPTAAIAPYVHGLYYPDTAINLPLSPCRNLKRCGGLLHSVLDLMDDEYLTFRHTTVFLSNNQIDTLTGIESNLQVGAGAQPITEFKDIKIGDLDPQLFKPIIISFTCRTPINMWKIMNTNTNGFIQIAQVQEDFTTKIYRGFLWKVKQNIGNNSATEFQLLACPDMVI